MVNHNAVPSYVPDSVLAYYQEVSENPYIQSVLPGYTPVFRRSSEYLLSPEPLTCDREKSTRSYWKAAIANVPNASTSRNLSRACNNSYGNNVLSMLFAYSISIATGYGDNVPMSMSFAQALAIHQATSYVDVLGYAGIATHEHDRVAWFAWLYWIIHPILEAVRYNRLLLYAISIWLDAIHHGLHAFATLITSGIRGNFWVVWYKWCYHTIHWLSLVFSFPTIVTKRDYTWNRLVCWSWITAHDYELKSHVVNATCCSVQI